MYSQPRWVLGHGHKINVRSESSTDLADIKEGVMIDYFFQVQSLYYSSTDITFTLQTELGSVGYGRRVD